MNYNKKIYSSTSELKNCLYLIRKYNKLCFINEEYWIKHIMRSSHNYITFYLDNKTYLYWDFDIREDAIYFKHYFKKYYRKNKLLKILDNEKK